MGPSGSHSNGLQANWASPGAGCGAFQQEVGPKAKQVSFLPPHQKNPPSQTPETWSYRQFIPVNNVTRKKNNWE